MGKNQVKKIGERIKMLKKIIYHFKIIAKAIAISFLALIILSIIIAAAIENSPIKDFLISALVFAIYLFFLYHTKISHNLDTYTEHNGKFDCKKEALAYLKTEGKYYFIIFVGAAILCELSYLIQHIVNSDSFRNPIVFICTPIFPFMNSIKIPILRSMVNIALVMFSTIGLELFKSNMINKLKQESNIV